MSPKSILNTILKIRDRTLHNLVHPLLLLLLLLPCSHLLASHHPAISTMYLVTLCCLVFAWSKFLESRSDYDPKSVTMLPAILLGIKKARQKDVPVEPVFKEEMHRIDLQAEAVPQPKDSLPRTADDDVVVRGQWTSPQEGAPNIPASTHPAQPPVFIKLVPCEEVNRALQESEEYIIMAAGENIYSTSPDRHDWLNNIIQHVWRSLKAACEDYILNIVWADVRKLIKKLPVSLEIDLFDLSLGTISPEFDKIKTLKVGSCMLLDLQISFPSDACIKVKVKTDVIPKLLAELHSLLLVLSVRMVVHQIIPRPPFVKAISVTLKSLPQIEWKLGGIAKIVDHEFLEKTIKSLIREQLAMFTSPHRITIPVSLLPLPPLVVGLCDQDELGSCVREIMPIPHGIVKVRLIRGENLPKSSFKATLTTLKHLLKNPPHIFAHISLTEKTDNYFIEMNCGGTTHRVQPKNLNIDTEFNITAEIPVEHPNDLEVSIYLKDKDTVSWDDGIGFIKEKLDYIQSNCQGEVKERWQGMLNTRARILLSYQWIPQLNLDAVVGSMRGTIAFSVVGIKSDSPVQPVINIKVSESDKSDGNDDNETIYRSSRTWISLLPSKELSEYKLKALVDPTWDLFMLQGGMLRILEGDTAIDIDIIDSLQRQKEVGRRKWTSRLSLEKVFDAAVSKTTVAIPLKKGFLQGQHIFNRVIQDIQWLGETVLGKEPPKLKPVEGEFLTISLQFSAYTDKSLGDESTASPPPSHTLGEGSNTSPPPGHTLGNESTASPPPTHPLGDESTASPPPGHTLGEGSTSSPPSTHPLGDEINSTPTSPQLTNQ